MMWQFGFSEFRYSVSGHKSIFAILISIKIKEGLCSSQNVAQATFSFLTHCTFWEEFIEQLLRDSDVRDRPGVKLELSHWFPAWTQRQLCPKAHIKSSEAALHLDLSGSDGAPLGHRGDSTTCFPLKKKKFYIGCPRQ